jgi:hypothetical protein
MHYSTIFLLASSAVAFKTSMYTQKSCTGMAVGYDKKVLDGCQEAIANVAGMINLWESEDDNNQLLVTYSDKTCCHANMIQMINWKVGCQTVTGGVGSWRVLNAGNWDQGKAGDNYTCGGSAFI